MSYTPTNWQNGDVITAEKLNHLEGGVEAAGGGEPFSIVFTYDYFNPDGTPHNLALDSQTSYDALVAAIQAKRPINVYLNDALIDLTGVGYYDAPIEGDSGVDILAAIWPHGGEVINISCYWASGTEPSAAELAVWPLISKQTIHLTESGGTFSVSNVEGSPSLGACSVLIHIDTTNNTLSSLGVNDIPITGYAYYIQGKQAHYVYKAMVITGSPAVLKEIVLDRSGIGQTWTVTVNEYALTSSMQ